MTGTRLGDRPRLGLRLQLLNPRAAVFDWLSGSVGDLRRTGSTSGSPEKRPDLRLRVSIRPNGVNLRLRPGLRVLGLRASGHRAPILRAPVSSPFDPAECHRFSARAGPAGVSPSTWTAEYVLGFPFGQSNWRAVPSTAQVETGPPGAQQGRLFAPSTNGHGLEPSPGMAPARYATCL